MYEWNSQSRSWATSRLRLVDESLRDGLQSASASDPPLSLKVKLLHAMAEIGVDVASVGLPAAGPRAAADAEALARECAASRLPLRLTAAARTKSSDVLTVAEASHRAGVPIEVYAFLGSSPIRQYVEGWSHEQLAGRVRETAEAARTAGLPWCLVIEDSTRTSARTLSSLFKTAVDAGAGRLCLCDTVGHVDPRGARALVRFSIDLLVSLGASHVELDWHGHNDRGLALANALAAAEEGVSGVHGTALGVGERAGNTPLELLRENLVAEGVKPEGDHRALERYLLLAAEVHRWSSPGGARPQAPRRCPSSEAPARAAPASARSAPLEPLVPLHLKVNGDAVQIGARPSRTLLDLLRDDLDLVGAKHGCDKGDCGACTVLVDGEPRLACLTLALSCEGREITTVESLPGAPTLDPLLDAFDRLGAGQCGYCTSGMLLTARALLRREPRPSRERVREAISGNLCRCTGYERIVDAILLASRVEAGEAGEARGGGCLPAPLPAHGEGKP